MKKILALLFVAFFLASCGNSPDKVAESFYESLIKGDIKKALKHVELDEKKLSDVEGKLGLMSSMYAEEASKSGGLKSVNAKTISKNENNARVEVIVIMNNGSRKMETVGVYKSNGKWYINF